MLAGESVGVRPDEDPSANRRRITAPLTADASGSNAVGRGPHRLGHPFRHHTNPAKTQQTDDTAIDAYARCFHSGFATVATATAASIGPYAGKVTNTCPMLAGRSSERRSQGGCSSSFSNVAEHHDRPCTLSKDGGRICSTGISASRHAEINGADANAFCNEVGHWNRPKDVARTNSDQHRANTHLGARYRLVEPSPTAASLTSLSNETTVPAPIV